MAKQELEKKIEMLERRIQMLEIIAKNNNVTYIPQYIPYQPLPTPPYNPTIVTWC